MFSGVEQSFLVTKHSHSKVVFNNVGRCSIRSTKALFRRHSGQAYNACAVPAIILQRKVKKNGERFTLTAKLNAISENLSFLHEVCAQNKVSVAFIFCIVFTLVNV